MDRREALKSILLVGGGLALFPSCLDSTKSIAINYKNFSISEEQKQLLAEITETLIPKTNTPGAKELFIPDFVLKMVDDTKDKESQDRFIKGLDEVDKIAEKVHGKSFLKCLAAEREEILKRIEKKEFEGDVQSFYPLVKELTILGYSNSKYVMTNLRVYELVPARFHGCVPVKQA